MVGTKSKDPFPYIVIDGALYPKEAQALADMFEDGDIWNKANNHEFSQKRSSTASHLWSIKARKALEYLNSTDGAKMIGVMFGFTDLVHDHSLQGGGLHEIREGGFLGVHTDFVKHPSRELYRRLNLLLYLNHDWEQMENAELGLYKDPSKPPLVTIDPKFNRMVIFETSDRSWHGHPRPLKCPPHSSRKSLALYYYTKEKPDFEISTNTVYNEAIS